MLSCKHLAFVLRETYATWLVFLLYTMLPHLFYFRSTQMTNSRAILVEDIRKSTRFLLS